MPPAPGLKPSAASNWPKMADSRAANRMSHASTNSLPAPRAPFDLRDGHDAACAQVAEKKPDGGFAHQPGRLLPVFLDPSHVDMGNEIVRVRTLEHKHLDRVVRFSLLNERDQITD